MIDSSNLAGLTGATVYDTNGDRIGKVGQVYVEPGTGRPNWASVKTGLFGTSESLVPLDDADALGDDIHVPFTKDFVKHAPRVDADRSLDHSEEGALYDYYRSADSAEEGAGDLPASATPRLRRYVITEVEIEEAPLAENPDSGAKHRL